MLDHADLTRRLANLVVGYGANVQPGQIVGVTTFPGKEELTREIARASYERGARWVDVLVFDPRIKRERLLRADETTLDYVPSWMVDRLEWLSDEHAARITLNGPADPEALVGVDPGRAGRDLLPYLPNVGDVVNRGTTNWCVTAAPTPGWAKLVYPELEPGEAYDRLWGAMAHVCRLDEPDPSAAWQERGRTLQSVAARLTERRFDAIRLHGPGTDLTVGLLPSSNWHAAGFETVDGLRHFPNLPSEEMFTTPDPLRADGHVTATRPLEAYGAMMDGIRVEFAGGRAVGIHRGPRRRHAPLHGGEGRRRIAPRRAGARRWRGAHRAARHDLLRDGARRERREPYRARERVRAGRRVGRGQGPRQPELDPRRLHDRLARARCRRPHRGRGGGPAPPRRCLAGVTSGTEPSPPSRWKRLRRHLGGAPSFRSWTVDANDGIIATSGVLEGFAGAGASHSVLVTAATAATVTGAVGLGGATWAENAAEREAQLELASEEREELAADPSAEVADLAAYYERKGLAPALAREVAEQLTAHDALAAQLESEHGIDEVMSRAAPVWAGVSAAIAFMLGAAVPLLITLTVSSAAEPWAILVAAVASLTLTSIVASRAGDVSVSRTLARTLVVGVGTLAISYLVGRALF